MEVGIAVNRHMGQGHEGSPVMSNKSELKGFQGGRERALSQQS